MSDFKAKMHKVRFPLGLRSRPRWGAYSAPPGPLVIFKGPTSNGREGKKTGEQEGKGERKGKRKKRGREGRGKEGRRRVRSLNILAYNRP